MKTEPVISPAPGRQEPGPPGRRRFRAMNTAVELYTRDAEDAGMLPAAEQVFHLMEARLSCLLPESELSQFNAAPGGEIEVSPILFDILQRAIELHRATDGAFDPRRVESQEVV